MIAIMTNPSNSSSLPLGVPRRIWIIAAVAMVFAIIMGLMMSGGPMFRGMGMRSQVELTNVTIDNEKALTRATTLAALSLGLSGDVTNNGSEEIWQIEIDVALFACPKDGGDSLDDCSLAETVSVLAPVTVPPGETRPFKGWGYVSKTDLPIGEAVRWTSEIDRIDTH